MTSNDTSHIIVALPVILYYPCLLSQSNTFLSNCDIFKIATGKMQTVVHTMG